MLATVLLAAAVAATPTPSPEPSASPQRLLSLIRLQFRSHRPPPPFETYTVERKQLATNGYPDPTGTYKVHVWVRNSDRAALTRKVFRDFARGDMAFDRPAFNEARDPGPPTADVFEPAPLRPHPVSDAYTPEPHYTPLPIIGPPGTAAVVEATLKAFGPDISYRIAHHDDLTAPPPVEVHEYTEGPVWDRDDVSIRVAPTDHRPVAPTIGFRIEAGGASVVLAGDTVPCQSLDELAAGADALVHTVIRKELIAPLPMQRVKDICDYHSSVQEAAATARRAGVDTLVLTHYVPAIAPGQEEQWRALAAAEFDGRIELGEDLHRVSRFSRARDVTVRRRPNGPVVHRHPGYRCAAVATRRRQPAAMPAPKHVRPAGSLQAPARSAPATSIRTERRSPAPPRPAIVAAARE